MKSIRYIGIGLIILIVGAWGIVWFAALDEIETLEACGRFEAEVVAFRIETTVTARILSVTGVSVTARDDAGREHTYSTRLRETKGGDRVWLERMCRESGEFSGEVRFLGPVFPGNR